MTIDNIALVRATNIIPFDGIIHPISNAPYLTKNVGLEFSARMSDLLNEQGVIPKMDYSKMYTEDDYYDKMVKQSSEILKEYIPYVSDYNSVVLFSLNGICPDDSEHGFGNNTFSNKTCAIIEPLAPHINEVISLVPTDTSVKGDVILSNETIILIEESRYNNLSEEYKLMLNTRKIILFQGLLKDAVFTVLKETGRYNPEVLSLSASTGGVLPSNTSEELKTLINQIIVSHGLNYQKYFNLLTTRDTTTPKYEEICHDFKNAIAVQDYYMGLFLESLLAKINAPIELITRAVSNTQKKSFILNVIELIKEYGIENYKQFLDEYNSELLRKQKEGELLTPEEIISGNLDLKRPNIK